MTPTAEQSLRDALSEALAAGHRSLAAGGSAVDAVVAAVTVLEDDSQFNAGRGSVFNAAGRLEMDAALMDGRARNAGAIAGVCGPRNPIQAARAVMDRSPHALLAGEGALAFLRQAAVPFEEEAYFQTERRWRALQEKLARQRTGELSPLDDADRHGTVGAVALDARGALAAGTSTGGMTAKLPGRIGDSPLIGAGTWASDLCAVSATGDGEHFIQAAAAHEVCARVRYAGESINQAAALVIAEIGKRGGSGGMIAVDKTGRVAMPFNSRGMYRGQVDAAGTIHTAIYREAP
jgi:isoaspartyl peptidase/L-asparaginase-like protein (Ntn-hydrolase superfamily)